MCGYTRCRNCGVIAQTGEHECNVQHKKQKSLHWKINLVWLWGTTRYRSSQTKPYCGSLFWRYKVLIQNCYDENFVGKFCVLSDVLFCAYVGIKMRELVAHQVGVISIGSPTSGIC